MPTFLENSQANGLNNTIASFQKSKKVFFQSFLLILKQNRQEKAKQNFYHFMISSLGLESLWTETGVVGTTAQCHQSTSVELAKKQLFVKAN